MAVAAPLFAGQKTQQAQQRSQALADAIASLGQQSPNVYRSGTGTNLSILSDLILQGSKAMQDNRVQKGLKSDQLSSTDAIMQALGGKSGSDFEGVDPKDAYGNSTNANAALNADPLKTPGMAATPDQPPQTGGWAPLPGAPEMKATPSPAGVPPLQPSPPTQAGPAPAPTVAPPAGPAMGAAPPKPPAPMVPPVAAPTPPPSLVSAPPPVTPPMPSAPPAGAAPVAPPVNPAAGPMAPTGPQPIASPQELQMVRSMIASDNPAMQQAGMQLVQEIHARAIKQNTPADINVSDGTDIVHRGADGAYNRVFDNPKDPSGHTPADRATMLHNALPTDDGTILGIMGDGTGKPIMNPETGKPYRAQQNFTSVQVGDVPTALNTHTGSAAPISTSAAVGANEADIATQKAIAKAKVDAMTGLPDVIAQADQTIGTVKDLVDDPGFNSRYGLQGILPALPGTPGATAQAKIDMVNGQNFMQAYAGLKGGGQITEVEGKKATAARSILQNQRISPTEARKAANDLIDITQNGILRAKAKAGMLDYSKLTPDQLDMLDHWFSGNHQ